MKSFRDASVILVLSLGAGGAAVHAQSPGHASFLGLQEFLTTVATADAQPYLAAPASRVRTAADFEEMRRHILTMYEGITPAHSFVLDSHYVDCIPIEQQPSARLLGLKPILTAPTPPPRPAGEEETTVSGTLLRSPLQLGLKDEFGNQVACDKGTIPMQRITLEELTRFETLQQFFQKEPGGGSLPFPAGGADSDTALAPDGADSDAGLAPLTTADTHQYAVAYQFVNNHGGSSSLNLWNPIVNVAAGQVFSLSQVWYAAGSKASTQTVEAGWQVLPPYYGPDARLFIYFTPDNYGPLGCYNLICPAFMLVANDWMLGGRFASYSATDGTQLEVQLQWVLSGGNWWLYLTGAGATEALGYYPGSIFRGGPMSRGSTMIEYGGEVVGATSWPQMGSGAFAVAGWEKAAFQRRIKYLTTRQRFVSANLRPMQTSPKCFTIKLTPAASGGAWGSYFFFGGPTCGVTSSDPFVGSYAGGYTTTDPGTNPALPLSGPVAFTVSAGLSGYTGSDGVTVTQPFASAPSPFSYLDSTNGSIQFDNRLNGCPASPGPGTGVTFSGVVSADGTTVVGDWVQATCYQIGGGQYGSWTAVKQ